MIALLDFVTLFMFLSLTLYLEVDEYQKNNLLTMEFLFLLLSTNGINIMLFSVKCYYGFKFLLFSYLPQINKKQKRNTTVFANTHRNTYHDETPAQEAYRLEMSQIKKVRRELNKYFLVSSMAYFFILI